MGIREEHRVRMLQDIQRAALDLVEEQGLEATTVGDIAARVGVSERTVFRYYPSKEHALMPGQQGLIDALVSSESAHHTPSGILEDLLAVCRELFSHEVEQRDFRRISRLLVQEPEMLRVVTRQERSLVEALSSALVHRGVLGTLQSLLIAEIVTACWRVAWQSFARYEVDGMDSDPVSLFDQTVRELGQLFPST
ncbi:hypothetical protein GCM10010977_04380 [Citricoccus zhacaiensis]|uniref:HTH tetR-type domain-containing protein n=2 Tax=Citricoccus zhacaiensis TaxID=489142 RepID=A0ABQ2LNP4_9MICC|nr:hypothetical protein GCM10010977_04380 [Citricoccus zhacaiensis]